MTLNDVLTAYCIEVEGIGANCGVPAYTTLSCAAVRSSVACCGICASISASLACGVPGTDASTKPRGPFAGMRAKSGGRLGVAYVHGPSRPAAANQRPDTR